MTKTLIAHYMYNDLTIWVRRLSLDLLEVEWFYRDGNKGTAIVKTIQAASTVVDGLRRGREHAV
jgi:hypothetical protein